MQTDVSVGSDEGQLDELGGGKDEVLVPIVVVRVSVLLRVQERLLEVELKMRLLLEVTNNDSVKDMLDKLDDLVSKVLDDMPLSEPNVGSEVGGMAVGVRNGRREVMASTGILEARLRVEMIDGEEAHRKTEVDDLSSIPKLSIED